jgi:hypothetical protein
MYAISVRINGNEPIIAGAEDLGILNAIISCSGKLGERSHAPSGDAPPDFALTLGGMTARGAGVPDEHRYWLARAPLQPGDDVEIQIVEVAAADPAGPGRAAQLGADDERDYFELCKVAYFSLRDKYEQPPAS